ILWVPLTKLISVREEALLGPCLFLITTSATHGSIAFEFLKSIEQGYCLQLVAACIETGLLNHTPLVNGILHIAHKTGGTVFLHQPVSIFQRFWEIVARINMKQGERQLCRIK